MTIKPSLVILSAFFATFKAPFLRKISMAFSMSFLLSSSASWQSLMGAPVLFLNCMRTFVSIGIMLSRLVIFLLLSVFFFLPWLLFLSRQPTFFLILFFFCLFIFFTLAFFYGLGNELRDKFNGFYPVVIRGDRIIDFFRIDVGVACGDQRNFFFICFIHPGFFSFDV